MERKNTLSRGRTIACVLACLLPAAVLCIGFYIICRGAIILNRSFVITFLILPMVTIGGNLLMIIRIRRRVLRAVLCILWLVALTFATFVMSLFGYYETIRSYENEEAYRAYSRAEVPDLMPAPEKLGAPEKLEFHKYFSQGFAIFTCDSWVLIGQYDQAAYAQEKALLDSRYQFQKNPMQVGYEPEYETEPWFEADGFTFRFLSVEGEYPLFYPKHLMLIGTNDTTGEIAYLYFSDPDLDYVTSVQGLLDEDFGWEHIR